MQFMGRMRLGLLTLFFACAGPVCADQITFENLPAGTIANTGGTNDIGTFYLATNGVQFGAGVVGLNTLAAGFDAGAFPDADGGHIVAFSPSADVLMQFSTPQASVSFFYSSILGLTLAVNGSVLSTGVDLNGVPLGTGTPPANTAGDSTIAPGGSDLVSISGANISSLEISSPGGTFIFDDLSFSAAAPAPVPEPGTAYLFAIAMLVFGGVSKYGRTAAK
jgi:hypothetical protein